MGVTTTNNVNAEIRPYLEKRDSKKDPNVR